MPRLGRSACRLFPMARKRKTLPKDFDKLLTSASLEELIAVFDDCEIDARGGYNKSTALGFRDCPDGLITWLVAQGLDVDSRDARGNTAVLERANSMTPRHSDQIPLLLSLGADIEAVDGSGRTAFQNAVIRLRPHAAAVLAQQGARVASEDWSTERLLEMALKRVENFTIVAGLDLTRLLLTLGASKTDTMRTAVERIGKGFEQARSAFAQDQLEQTSAALDELYAIFAASPAPARIMHDGVSPIEVAPGRWQDQHRLLWELLVPVQGHAPTEQGEVVRISGKVADEMFRNGGANWNSDFRTMVDSAVELLSTRTALSEQSLADLRELAPQVRAGRGAGPELDRFAELAVEWVGQNPQPHALVPSPR